MFVTLPKIVNGKLKMTTMKVTEMTGFEDTIMSNGKPGVKVYTAGGHFKVQTTQLELAAACQKALSTGSATLGQVGAGEVGGKVIGKKPEWAMLLAQNPTKQ
jgi:hypothetical protein